MAIQLDFQLHYLYSVITSITSFKLLFHWIPSCIIFIL
jgi:hypothetical protein